MSILDSFLIVIILIILVIIAVLIPAAAVRITSIKDYESNGDLKNAHQKLTVAAVAAWISILIFIFIIVYYLSKTNEVSKKETSSEVGIRISIIIAAILIFIEGILAAIASVDMDKAKSTGIDNTGARSLSNTAAILGIVGGVICIILLISSLVPKKKETEKKEGEKGEKEGAEEGAGEDVGIEDLLV